MKKVNLIFLFTLAIMVFSCKGEKKENDTEESTTEPMAEEEVTETQTETPKVIELQMEPKSESDVNGKITFTEENGTVTMVADLKGLAEGGHAIHLHEKADCSSPDGKSSGGHWNPTMEKHGKWGDNEGYHKGDIGNFNADAEGNGSITFSTNEWCIGCEDEKKNILGKAVIVHQGTDDFTSQPSGAAGSRVSCGAVIQ